MTSDLGVGNQSNVTTGQNGGRGHVRRIEAAQIDKKRLAMEEKIEYAHEGTTGSLHYQQHTSGTRSATEQQQYNESRRSNRE